MKKIILFIFITMIFEVFAIFFIGKLIGGWITFLLIILGFIVGISILKAVMASVMSKVKNVMTMQETMSEAVIQSIIYLLAGVFFIIPGFISDIFAIMLLIPPIRNFLVEHTVNIAKNKMKAKFNQNLKDVVDKDVIDVINEKIE